MKAHSIGLLALIFLLAAAAAGFFYFQRDRLFTLTDQLPALELPDIAISTPGPLRGRTDAPVRTLTVEGILRETNRHRAENNLPPLTLNAKLSAAAQAKVSDMFRQQYFDHVGPDGRGPSDWVDDAGYDYIAVGENLALGNFDSDTALVQAWMNSPGHRANILNSGFKEIGLAATAGTFEDSRTWLAVQEFATPASACPTPATTLRTQYEQTEAESEQLHTEIESTKDTLEKLIAEYERLVAEEQYDEARALEPEIRQREAAYNDFVNRYNALVNELKSLANQLNSQINAYNACVGSLG